MSSATSAAADDGFVPPIRGLCAAGLALASFMQVLDSTIANVSLPTIAGNLGAGTAQATWVITSFAVSTAIALPLTGWLSRRFGEVRLFLGATLAFTLASLLCGLAHSMGFLVAARTLQGFCAGPLFPITQALLVAIYPREKRGQALALLSLIVVVAPIAGPILGGWITDNYSWEWIFLINVPLGLIATGIVSNQLKHFPKRTEKARMDYIGLASLMIGVGALQIVLDLGNDEDWFESDLIIALSVVSAVALLVFVIWELTDKEPIVDLKLFRHRNFRNGTLAMVLAYSAFVAVVFLVPQWLQRDMGYTALWAGLATAPLGVLSIVLAPFIGKYSGRIDLRLLATLAFIFLSITCFMRADFNLEVDFNHVAGVQLLMGAGVALFFMPVLQILLSDLSGSDIASGSGLATFLRTLGGSFATSLTTWLWGRRGAEHHAQLTEHISAYIPGVTEQLTELGQGDPTRGAALLDAGVISHQASQMGFNDIFYLLGWVFLAIIVFLWLAKPPFGGKTAGASAGH